MNKRNAYVWNEANPVKWATFTLLLVFLAAPLTAQSPPPQPQIGPGGTNYVHDTAKKRGPYWAKGHFFDRNYRYFIYEPDSPKPTRAPVVLFIHGWLAYNPRTYEGWIQHIVKKGYTVVWVQYDAGLRPPGQFADHAIVAWRDALNRLNERWWGRHVKPELNELGQFKTAMVGHSAGGYLSAILAARASDPSNQIPKPYAVVAVEPGGLGIIPGENLAAIDPGTKMVLVVGDEDKVVCQSTAVHIWNSTPQILESHRDFLLVRSDYAGTPAQVANHYFPANGGFRDTAKIDARDFYVTFKLSVGALNCAFQGVDCEFALGNGSNEQVDMGEWSDGRLVNPMMWTEDPTTLDAQCNGN